MTYRDFINEWKGPQPFIRAHTSGSTGQPKEIKLSKDFVAQSAYRTIDFFGIKDEDILYSCVSPDFIGGKMMAVRALLSNAELCWEDPSNQPLKDLTSNRAIKLLAVVPSQMIFLCENKDSLPHIENIIVGGSPINPSLREMIVEAGFNAYETYGMTETASHIALRKIEKISTPFELLPGITINTVEDDCLKISFPDDLEIQTNDIAELITPKKFYIKGRRDNMIISGARKVNPLEIEDKISKFISSPFCIVGVPDKKWGQKVVLLIEGVDSDYPNLKTELQKALKNWEVPKEIKFLTALPRTQNGKILRTFLKNLSSD
ncbi:MAG: AMP-binding protein [Muribaculaceae bacterium]|nr:AMP-binding protein [Muribaculaceae bacterium]